MALANSPGHFLKHRVPDYDGHVDRTNSCSGLRGFQPQKFTRCQYVRDVILAVWRAHDFCSCLGLCELLDESSAKGRHNFAVLWSYVPLVDDSNGCFLARAHWNNHSGLRRSLHHQQPDRYLQQVVFG